MSKLLGFIISGSLDFIGCAIGCLGMLFVVLLLLSGFAWALSLVGC